MSATPHWQPTRMHAEASPNQILGAVSLPTSFGMAAESLDPAPPMVSRALHFDSGRTKKDAELFDLALSKRDGTLWCDSGRQTGCQIPQRVCPQNSGVTLFWFAGFPSEIVLHDEDIEKYMGLLGRTQELLGSLCCDSGRHCSTERNTAK